MDKPILKYLVAVNLMLSLASGAKAQTGNGPTSIHTPASGLVFDNQPLTDAAIASSLNSALCNIGNNMLGGCVSGENGFASFTPTVSGSALTRPDSSSSIVTTIEVTEEASATQTLPFCQATDKSYVISETNAAPGGYTPTFAAPAGWTLTRQLGGSAPTGSNTVAGKTDVYSFRSVLPNKEAFVPANAPANENSGTGGTTPNSPDPDGVVNVVNYGADPTGVADSAPAVNAAFEAACENGTGLNNFKNEVYLPPGHYRAISEPFMFYCAPTRGGKYQTNLPDIRGAGRASVVLSSSPGANFQMPTMVMSSENAIVAFEGTNLLLQSPLVGSTGDSILWSGGTPGATGQMYWLSEALGPQPVNGAARLTVEGFINTTTNSAFEYIIGSDGSATPVKTGCGGAGPNGNYTCKGAFSVSIGSDGKLYGSINTSVTGWTGPARLKSARAIGANTTIYYQLSYDGARVRLYHATPGASELTEDGSAAQTGTVVERVDEDLTLGAINPYWHLVNPGYWFQGHMDAQRMSISASDRDRCTSDVVSGCPAPKAKFPTTDSKSLWTENWSNTQFATYSPLVKPEVVKGTSATATTGSWMVTRSLGIGNSAGRNPIISDLTLSGNSVCFIADVASPWIRDVMWSNCAYGLELDQANDYNALIQNVYSPGNNNGGSAIQGIEVPGLTPILNPTIACGVNCIETNGLDIENAELTPSSHARWNILVGGNARIANLVVDNENGCSPCTPIQLSQMAGPNPSSVEVDNSELIAAGAGGIVTDGAMYQITVRDSIFEHAGGTGPYVDVTDSITNGIDMPIMFINDIFPKNGGGLGPVPTVSGDSYTNDPNGYSVTPGTNLQTITGTAGTAKCMMSSLGTSKTATCYLNAYQETSTAQTYTYPVPFTTYPSVVEGGSGGNSCGTYTSRGGSLTVLTLPANASMRAETCSITVSGQ